MKKFIIMDKLKFVVKKKPNSIKIYKGMLKDFDLLEAYQLLRKKDRLSLKTFGIVIGVEIFLFFIVSAILGATAYKIKAENSKIEEQIIKNSYIEQKISSYKTIKSMYEEKQAVYNDISLKNQTVLDVLKTISESIPKEMSVDNISINGDKLSIIVKSTMEENIVQFINNLQDSEKFKNMVISGISNDGNYKRTTINAEIVRK